MYCRQDYFQLLVQIAFSPGCVKHRSPFDKKQLQPPEKCRLGQKLKSENFIPTVAAEANSFD